MKLGRQKESERDDLIARILAAKAELAAKIEAANDAIRDANVAREAFNTLVNDASEWAQAVADALEEQIGEKTERWQEGETGQAVAAMLSEYQSFSPDEIEEYQELDDPEDPTDDLAQLPSDHENFL
jgi:cobalamin biosynthesis protein CbiD